MDRNSYNGMHGEPDEVPYSTLCSCNPSNGGSGICGCIMGNTMVKNPKKFGTSTTSTNNLTYFNDFIKESTEQDPLEKIITNNSKINILSTLIEITEKYKSKEDNDKVINFIDDAKKWLEELKTNNNK